MAKKNLIIENAHKALAVVDLMSQLSDTPVLLGGTLARIGEILTGYLHQIEKAAESFDTESKSFVDKTKVVSNTNDEVLMPVNCIKCLCEFIPKSKNQYYCSSCRQQKIKLCKTCGQKFAAEGREQWCDSCRQSKVEQITAKYQNPNQLDKEIDKWLGVEEK